MELCDGKTATKAKELSRSITSAKKLEMQNIGNIT